MKIYSAYSQNNDCFQKNQKITIKGIMLHSVGCAQPSAEVFVRNQNKPNLKKCVHAFIDANTGDVYETLPHDTRGWHCGKGKKGSANGTHIGVEMCEPSAIKYVSGTLFNITNNTKAVEQCETSYVSAVKYFAYLCSKYSLNPMQDGVVISHSEGYKRGLASNHADCEHLWNGIHKFSTMDRFRNDVALEMSQMALCTPYKVKINCDALNVRKNATTKSDVVGMVHKGEVYTIIKEENGFGRLKSGMGWISLKYVKAVN